VETAKMLVQLFDPDHVFPRMTCRFRFSRAGPFFSLLARLLGPFLLVNRPEVSPGPVSF
jgi:hypothetical protein